VIAATFEAVAGRVQVFDADSDGRTGARAIRACICVPMRLREAIVGVLYLDNRIFPSAFAPEDIPVLDYFAAQASIAMENARAYSLLQTRYLKQKEELQHHERQYLERLHFDEMVGQSAAIRRVFAQIDSVAATDATVLIHGETGVGKELVARAIHRSSLRKEGPFIRVNCSAFSEHLIASELFGHEKGAFTGASQTHLGRFELAHGGTLFLDEIGDIPSAVQVRLLRVLQSHEFERVGGQTTLHSDFRLMVATNRDLLAAVSAGSFRQDLYYRLNVFPIEVPPLRARGEDIPLLAAYFLNKYAGQHGKQVAPIPAKLAARLAAYPWPGNVRELENYVERAVILSSGDRLQLPVAGLEAAAVNEAVSMVSHAENERRHIIRALKQVGGRVAGPGGAAELLELHPNTLRYRIKKLGITAQDWVA
jgi:transcriptional regulator with GAF, ATPase, and Fis domain